MSDPRPPRIGEAESPGRAADAPPPGEEIPDERVQPERPGPSIAERISGRAELIALVIAGLIAFSLLWIASEMHYRGCIQAAEVKSQGDTSSLGRLIRQRDLRGCSRLPF